MAFTEVLVRRTRADEKQVGTVVGVRGKTAKTFQVRWADGREERVRLDTATDALAPEGSALLDWLLDPASFAQRFQRDAEGVFVDLIKSHHGEPMSSSAVKKALIALGVSEAAYKSAWTAAQPKLKRHKHIVAKGVNYTWSDEPVDPYADIRALSPAKAFDQLLKSRKAEEKAVLVEVVRAGLHGSAAAASQDARADAVRAAELREVQDQKVRARGVQAFASLAMEIEELVANGAEADILIERVRRSAGSQDLTPIESAGGTTSFDRAKHSPIVGSPKDGTQVTVVRPGYSWRTPKEDVLVAKALVIEQ